MKYVGSKNRIAKNLLPIILKDRKPNQWYVEPFVGGCNMMDKVDGLRIGNDVNHYLIAMWKDVLNGWTPPDYIELDVWKDVKTNPEKYDPGFVAFARFGCSFGAGWNAGFARTIKQDKPNADILNRTTASHCKRSKKNILKQIPYLKDVIFTNVSYKDMVIPPNSIIYCDPPYQNDTASYSKQFHYNDFRFNHKEFWEWCRIKTKEGHKVFISEYQSPDDFECIYSQPLKNRVNNLLPHKIPIEKLFIYNI